MIDLISLLMLLLGLAAGSLLMFFYLRGESARLRERIENLSGEQSQLQTETITLRERNNNLQHQFQSLEKERSGLMEQNRDLNSSLTETRTTNRHLEEKLSSFKKEIEEIQTGFRDQFKVLADEIMEEKSKKFSEQNKVNMEQLLNPLGEKIKTFEKRVEETYKEDVRDRISLKEQISQLSELNNKMTQEAGNLTRALKGESKSQGSWGEMILERILEKSGLRKDREYVVQPSFTEDGARKQPDVIIHLPDEKHLVIDSKVSLVSYEKYVSAEDQEDRAMHIKDHIRSVRKHIKELSEKNYQNIYGINSPDFVLMFMPVEPAFGLAIEHESELYNDAFDKNIVLVSPTTLLATLATISNIWKQEYQNRNAVEIADAGGKLYDKFVGFAEDLVDLGKRLDQTRKSYDGAMNKLQDGRGNLIRQAERMRDLGARSSKTLPASVGSRYELDDSIPSDDRTETARDPENRNDTGNETEMETKPDNSADR